MLLEEDQIAAFRRDGFLFPLDVHDAAEAEAVRAEWDEFEVRDGLRDGPRDRLYSRHLDQEFIWKIVTHPTILDALEPFIGPNILLFGSRVICKWPQEDSVVAWHQDVSERNRLTPPAQITGWYAIDDVGEDNGCVICVPGSHRRGMLRRHAASISGNLLRVNEHTEVSGEEEASAVPIVLRAGQVSLHDGLTLHSSRRNSSPRRRCGLVIRYVPADVRQGAGVEFNQRETAIALRGIDELNGTAAPPVWPAAAHHGFG